MNTQEQLEEFNRAMKQLGEALTQAFQPTLNALHKLLTRSDK